MSALTDTLAALVASALPMLRFLNIAGPDTMPDDISLDELFAQEADDAAPA